MKKIILLSLAFILAEYSVFAQNTNPFDVLELFWYGLDFTKAKMVGNFSQFSDAGEKDGYEIKSKYYPGWNRTILEEPEKYNLGKFFNVRLVNSDINVTDQANSSSDPTKIMNIDYYNKPLTDSEIQECVNRYQIKEKSGVGVVIIVEKFDKYEESGTMHVVYFDIATKNVLFSQRMMGKAMGFGIRNYWIRTVYNVMNQIPGEQKRWRKGFQNR